jgi:hypothetical protein
MSYRRRVECSECGRVAFRRTAELGEVHRVDAGKRAQVCPGRWRLEPKADRIQPEPGPPWDGRDHTAEFLAMPPGPPWLVDAPAAVALVEPGASRQLGWAW